jgi:hypothetical protein
MGRYRRPSATVLLASAVVVAGGLVGLNLTGANAATTAVNVTVNARAGLATVPGTAFGVNDAIWDANLGTAQTSDLLKAAGVQMMRYPGGSYGDIYHWQDNTAPGGYVAPGTDFDTFMASVQRVGAQPMLIANYGTGTATEAAGWVRYANVTKRYGAKYWEIGNENYGNGHYGSAWEADNHADKSPTGYANEVVAYAQAMKAVDPTVKIGAVLTMPAGWPDAIVGSGDTGTWNQVVLSIAGPYIDFADIHWYPGGSSAADSLSKPVQIDSAMYLVRQQIAKYSPANAGTMGISLTETNVGVGQNTQPAALYLADTYSGLLENGVFTVDWWDVHNGAGTVSTVDGQTDYNDFGMLSSGTCTADGATCEPAVDTPFAPYYGLQLMSTFAHTGDQFIRAGTDQALVSAHAVRRSDGDVDVLLVNKDPDNSYPVSIDYAGFSASSATPTVYSLVNGATSIASAQTGSATSQTLAPYSLTVVVVHPASASSGAPDAPGQPTASGVAATAATISWPAAKAGSHPIAKYEVYRQNGTISEQLGETSGTSLTVGNLRPGTPYTINVLTRDTAGNVSWSSGPLTFTTGTPTTSSCAVQFADVNDWVSGYVGSINITNTGTAAINGWTLTFTWPESWQSLSSGWSGNWAQSGSTVTVTSTTDNATLAVGATTNTGFVASYSGPDVPPLAFTLNGTVCGTSS